MIFAYLGPAGCWEPARDLCLRVLPLKTSPVCGACRTPTPRQTTAFTCVFRCFPCDPSCGSASWATPEFTPRSAAPMVKMTRSKTFQAYLPSCHRTYSCIHCRAHLANHNELISKSFQGSQGWAYLFNSVVNMGCGLAEEHVLLTGLHAATFTVKTAKPPWAGNMNMPLKAARHIKKANTSLS